MLTLLITQFIIFWTVVGRIRATSVSTRLNRESVLPLKALKEIDKDCFITGELYNGRT